MDGADPTAVRRPTLKERLGFNSLKGLGCCGVTSGLEPTTITEQDIEIAAPENTAAALDSDLPGRVSLMRLLDETDVDVMDAGGGVCCVCMGRKKGAAFIPCGHTFCRVCSRELWLNRGSCPLCNRHVLRILDIY